jgi:NADPH:quinone reductase-like Zn-dependent oxidoreductase
VRAVRLHPPGGLDGLVLERIDTPQPGTGEALVAVHAAAITRDELDWPTDRLPAIPSYELSGTVAAVGPGVEEPLVGTEVWALTGFDRDGAAADYAVVPTAFLAPKPTTLGHVESAAVPLAGLSAWQGLFEHGALAAGQRVLIHGAAGGVGHLAVQLARERGAHVIATTSTGVLDAALAVDELIDDAATPFDATVHDVDLVFDTAGGDRLRRSAGVLRPGGRLVSIAAEPPPERGGEIGSVYFVVEPNREQLVELARRVDDGRLRPLIDQVFPLERAREAFARVAQGGKRGKVVLRVGAAPEA